MTSMNPLLSSGRTSCEPEFASPSPDHTNTTTAEYIDSAAAGAKYIRSTTDIKNLYAAVVHDAIVAAAAYRARAILNAYSPATPKRAHAEPVSDAAITARYYPAVTSANDAIEAAYSLPAPPGFAKYRLPPGFSLVPGGIMKVKLAYNRWRLGLDPLPASHLVQTSW